MEKFRWHFVPEKYVEDLVSMMYKLETLRGKTRIQLGSMDELVSNKR